MARPVVHFEISGRDPGKLRGYYGELFGWEYDTEAEIAGEVSEAGNYGFVDRNTTDDGTGIPGGIGGGADHVPYALFYVGVPDVGAALADAERLGGTRLLGPVTSPTGLVVAHFADPEGNLVGLAGPA
jgi:uncharacterized protein